MHNIVYYITSQGVLKPFSFNTMNSSKKYLVPRCHLLPLVSSIELLFIFQITSVYLRRIFCHIFSNFILFSKWMKKYALFLPLFHFILYHQLPNNKFSFSFQFICIIPFILPFLDLSNLSYYPVPLHGSTRLAACAGWDV